MDINWHEIEKAVQEYIATQKKEEEKEKPKPKPMTLEEARAIVKDM